MIVPWYGSGGPPLPLNFLIFYFIVIKESTFWWIIFQQETVWFQRHTFMATSWLWMNPHSFIFTILWHLRLFTSWISENQKINRIHFELQQWLPMVWLIKTREFGGILVVDLIHPARYQKLDILLCGVIMPVLKHLVKHQRHHRHVFLLICHHFNR